MKLQNNSW